MENRLWLSFCVFVISVVFICYLFVCKLCRLRTRKRVHGVCKALLVIAHPDDECMFFGPSVIGLLQQECELYLLCLSIGDYYKRGKERKEELHSSCRTLGIRSDNIIIVQHSNMPDDPDCVWSSGLVGRIVQKYIKCLSVDAVITFDHFGVSGHPNHVATHKGIVDLLRKGRIPPECKVFALESVNKLRKYCSLLDVPLSYVLSDHAYVLPWSMVSLVKAALHEHKSQMLWFRRLYSYFSRYMVINTLFEVKVEKSKGD
ncbi:unnamed protein product [Ixodes hexagonus]